MINHEPFARHFLTFDKWLGSEPLGAGHINDTFKIGVEKAGQPQFFVLQRVNHLVFQSPEAVAANARRIAAELEKSESWLARLAPFSAADGSDWARDSAGGFWRVGPFAAATFSPEKAETADEAFEIARAFGQFLRALRCLEPTFLAETIPGFHDTPRRWAHFEAVLAENRAGRAEGCRREIDLVLSKKGFFEHISRLKKAGRLPLRAVHSDAKAGNALLDESTRKAVAVIDWDTAGPETLLVDFADLVRSTASNLAEDDAATEKMELRLPILQAVGEGFLTETADFLTRDERENLLAGAAWIVFEQGLRFLTDHLEGDVYYKIERAGHNLDRAHNQLRLLQLLEGDAQRLLSFF